MPDLPDPLSTRPPLASGPQAGGRTANNILHFVRLLRRAGVPTGTDQAVDALRAAGLVGVVSRTGLYWALRSVLVRDARQLPVFDHAFASFWKDPFGAESALAHLLPRSRGAREPEPAPPGARRVAEAWPGGVSAPDSGSDQAPEPTPFGATLHWSSAAVARSRDFAQMSARELAEARRAIDRLQWNRAVRPTRRWRRHGGGPRIDLRATIRQAVRTPAAWPDLVRRRRVQRPPPIVALCDISGSMDAYARIVLHLLHTWTRVDPRTETFLFGTRLWYVSRTLRTRDLDEALARVGDDVTDWSGGTRIGANLDRFLRIWGRRVLTRDPVVILLTDGLDRGDLALLDRSLDRLRRLSGRLIWLNPLLSFQGFEPKAAGVTRILEHADLHLPVHNLKSLDALVDVLGRGA